MTPPLDPGFRPLYHQLHRVGRPGIWRSLVGIVTVGVVTLLVAPLVVGAGVVLVLMASGQSFDEARVALDITREVTPTGLAFINLMIALGIPVVWLVTWKLHGLKPRWTSSVAPRLRWGYLFVCTGLSVVALLASLMVAFLLPMDAGETPMTEVNEFTDRTVSFLLVILLLTPLQAAGEEYVFRGYLTQAFGSVVTGEVLSKALAVTCPALLFALAHGSQDVPMFFDRFAFGVMTGILVLVTGGLEAGIAMHVLNNFLAYALALAFGDMTQALTATTAGSWWMIVTTVTRSVVYLGLAVWVARAMGLVVRGPAVGSVLESPTARV